MPTFTCRPVALTLAALSILTIAGGTAARAAEPNAVQAKAQKGIQSNAANIVKLAYLQSTGHTATDYVKGTVYGDGDFHLTYKFNYRDENHKAQSFTTRFEFSEAGKLRKLTPVSNTDWWPQFGSAALIGAAFDELAKEFRK